MLVAGSRIRVASAVLLASVLAVSFTASNTRAGGPPPIRTTEISGDQVFPPGSLTRESEQGALVAWLNAALGLNATIGPSVTPESLGSEMSFIDGFNRTIYLPINGSDYREPSGTLLSLYYVRTTAEFEALDIRFGTPLPMESGDLRTVSTSLAASLGIPLATADYMEYDMHTPVPGSNGTGETIRTTRWGMWSETHESLKIDFANQLRLFADADARALIFVRIFRWIENPPPIQFTVNRILQAASDAVNLSYGSRAFASSFAGLTPNFQNMTWSFFVGLSYPMAGGGGEEYAMLLDAQNLAFQRLVYRSLKTPDSPGTPPYIFGATALAAIILVGAAYLAMRRRRRTVEKPPKG